MADPFEALRTPVVPLAPDPAFAARLRARVADALDLPDPGGPAMTTIEPTTTAGAAARPTTAGVTPYISVSDGHAAIEWYVEALGARLDGDPIVMDDGRVGHAELVLNGGYLYLAASFPESGVEAPQPGSLAAVTLHLTVDDVDSTLERAVDAGASVERPPYDNPYGRGASFHDPFGHRWLLHADVTAGAGAGGAAEAAGDPVPTTVAAGAGDTVGAAEEDDRPHQGDVGYASLQVGDVARAAEFYGRVLGWRYEPVDRPESRRVQGLSMHLGLWGGGGYGSESMFLAFAVDDVAAAVERVRAAGGTATEPEERPYGTLSDCVDDQGMAFALYTPPAGERSGRPPLNGRVPGDVSYLTMMTPDSERARAFYGSVLGWEFNPGRVENGWEVLGVHPMTGMWGGSHDNPVERPSVVPMYRTDDIEAAVRRVRESGGTATDVEQQPYGLSSECTDDQGVRFWLGQL